MTRTIEEQKFFFTADWIYKRKIRELETAEEKVVWLLARKEHLRNCDKCLIFYYWRKIDGFNKLTPEQIHSLTSSETIRRVRQKIQNELGLYLPTNQETREARNISEEAFRDWINYKRDDKDEDD